jgi:hypothetical protein
MLMKLSRGEEEREMEEEEGREGVRWSVKMV